MRKKALLFLFLAVFFCGGSTARAVENTDCLACHEDESLLKFKHSVHGSKNCVDCHTDLAKSDFPHETPAKHVEYGVCHAQEEKQFKESLHGQAFLRGDSLAPRCVNCHGNHDILPVKDKDSKVSPLRIPFVCGGRPRYMVSPSLPRRNRRFIPAVQVNRRKIKNVLIHIRKALP